MSKFTLLLLLLVLYTTTAVADEYIQPIDTSNNMICSKDEPFKYYVAYQMIMKSGSTYNFAWQCLSKPADTESGIKKMLIELKKHEKAQFNRSGYLTILTIVRLSPER